ncbi:MAG: SdiA-regulated domain-containing protein [Bacteroidota bacterium]
MKMTYSSFVFLIACHLMGCGDPSASTSSQQAATSLAHIQQLDEELPEKILLDSSYQFPYELNEPDETLKLSDKLLEISGLSLSTDKDKLCAVQDEKGIIFQVSKKSGKIEDKIDFWKTGDYEGIEIIGKAAYVVKSTGTIYEVENMGTSKQNVNKYNTFLGRENDVEGLCYDRKNNRLLLACKGRPATGESLLEFRSRKCIYGFDLQSKQLDSLPAFTIMLDEIQDYLINHPLAEELNKLIEFFTPEKENLNFNPSSIGIHPTSGNIYLTSSVGKVLIVLNPAGKILYMEKMKKKLYPQPEGITFDKDGTLYISSEGKEGKARIQRLSPRLLGK